MPGLVLQGLIVVESFDKQGLVMMCFAQQGLAMQGLVLQSLIVVANFAEQGLAIQGLNLHGLIVVESFAEQGLVVTSFAVLQSFIVSESWAFSWCISRASAGLQ